VDSAKAPAHFTFVIDRKPKRYGVFQLPVVAFLLNACALDYFREQKTKVTRVILHAQSS
jgi:outer membrane biogenesis lipoprotein LolB